MHRLIVGCCLVTLFVGCGSDDGDGTPATPTGGSSSNTGGTSNTGGVSSGGSKATGGASTGGTSMAGSSGAGGGATTGGKSGAGGAATGGRPNGGGGGRGGSTGGSAGSATGGTPTAPMGPVDTCDGEACPLGECDNGGFFADEKCSDVYSGPVDEESMFCADDGGYCLTTITNVLTNWAITCSGRTPRFDLCQGGCGVAGLAASCN